MRFPSRSPFTVIAPLIVGCTACAFAQDAPARQTYTSADKAFAFTYPQGWKAAEAGVAIHLTAPDGSRYTIGKDSLGAAPAGEAANSPALRSAAEAAAKPLMSGAGYAGVKVATLDAGSGAIYRFRGQGAKSGNDLVEVWIGVIGSHTVELIPDAAPLPDHSYELSTVFRSLSFADSPGRATANRPGRAGKQQAALTTGQAAPVAPTDANQATARTVHAPPAVPKSSELERYDGHLISGDIGFTLRLNHDATASATWMRTIDHILTFAGNYTGEDGNYSVTLKEAGARSTGASTLALTIRSIGGMVGGQYLLATGAPKREIAELKLTEVDSGGIKLKGTQASARPNSGCNANQNRSPYNMRRGGRGNRRP